MPFDRFDITALVEELNRTLLGTAVTDVVFADRSVLWLELDRSAWLYVTALPHFERILISTSHPPEQAIHSPDGRWRALHGTIEEIRQQDEDRIVRIRLSDCDRIGTETRLSLIVELTGRNSNIILLDERAGVIVTSARKVPAEKSRVRQILPGVPYVPPPPPTRPVPGRSSFDDFVHHLSPTTGRSIRDTLARTLSGADALIAGEICYAAGLASDLRMDELNEEARRALWAAACALYEDPPWIQNGAHLILDERGDPLDLSAIVLRHVPSERTRAFPSFSQAIEAFYESEWERRERDRQKRELQVFLDGEISGLRRTLGRIERDRDRSQRAELFQRKGHLLMGALHLIRRGATSVEIEDYSMPDAPKLTIELDPRRSPVENAQQYFAKYRKARDGASVVEKRFVEIRTKIEEMDALRGRLEEITHQETSVQLAEFRTLRGKLVDDGLLRERRTRSAKGDADTPRIAPRRYVTSDGWVVLVGRSKKENDLLTHRMADRDDIWFHAQGCPGAHVVLRRAGRKGDPSARTLEEAASLAAYWSRARGSTVVPVDYTLVKYVTKPRGGGPGLARIQREKTLTVAPGLLAEEDSAMGGQGDSK